MYSNCPVRSDLVYFQQNTWFVGMITVTVVACAVEFGVGFQIFDVKFTELLSLLFKCVVTSTVHTAVTCCPIFIVVYNTQHALQTHTYHSSIIVSQYWVPYKKGDIEVLEKVQKKATNIVHEISQPINHTGTALKYVSCRRHVIDSQGRYDRNEMYNILTGQYDADVTLRMIRVYGSTTSV